ncbi:MAG: deoxyuridine 5'-triphosphate nucleotidohydrolase [Lachnospiraceae bacterium]|nr:deoxyuridine 5'-triphosphate nucleotidohydrolase [Lachnospiraceae bacterium]MBR5369314.1 deoxyuridine 5'-triphosphate nucleotidohydrolase [Lachnospiraceae bacterium]
MVGMAQFSKVSSAQFVESATDKLGITPQEAISVYASITLPKRATSGSAGYDFFTPVKIELAPGESLSVPTGIRARIDDGWVLMLYPRSGLGFKYGMMLANTVGVIDSDYYHSDNEGHIIAKITNTSSDKTITVEAGKGFIQGVFTPFGITVDDDADGVRNGGFGSTTK